MQSSEFCFRGWKSGCAADDFLRWSLAFLMRVGVSAEGGALETGEGSSMLLRRSRPLCVERRLACASLVAALPPLEVPFPSLDTRGTASSERRGTSSDM